jgi:copper(I)-binding protein
MNLLVVAALLAASTVSMPTASGPIITIVAHHGSIYQTKKAGDPTEGFFDIENTGVADTLTAAICPIADSTTLVGADGKPITGVAVPALQNINLTANGPHLLLQSTHFSVQYGGIIPCSVTFTNAGTLSIFLYATPKP